MYLPSMVISSLLGVPLQRPGDAAQADRPGLPHRARRRHGQRRLAHRADRAQHLHPVAARRGAANTRATTCSPTSVGRDHRGRRRRPAGSRSRRAPTSPTCSSARAPRRWPACSAGRRSSSTRTPTSGPSSRPIRRCCRTRSRSCCATRRRHRCRVGGPPSRRRAARRDRARRVEGPAAHRLRRPRRARLPRRRPLRHPPRTSTTTCRSATASTSASVRRWPAWRAGSALEETLARFPEWEVDHDSVVRLHTSTVRGFARGAHPGLSDDELGRGGHG